MAQKKFEEAMKRLEEITRDLEGGDLPLEESLKTFEEGMRLINFCSQKLDEVEQKVTKLMKDRDGKFVHQPFDIDEKVEE